MLERGLSRRVFLGLFGGGAALSGLPLASASVWIENSGVLNEEPRMEGPLKVGNLQLSVLTMGHSRDDWFKYQDTVKKLIDTYPVIIPEYFPPEYSGTNGNRLTEGVRKTFKDANYLFDEVEAYCRNSKKEVWIVDPAYNTSFMVLRGGMFLAETVGLFEGLGALGSTVKRRNSTFTRRNFLEHAKDFGLAAATFSIGVFTPPEILSLSSSQGIVGKLVERHLRYILIASLLKDLSAQVPPKTQGLLIYPNIHWESIKKYLENDGERRSGLSKIAWLKNVPGANYLFQGRHYISDGYAWSEQQRIEVNTT